MTAILILWAVAGAIVLTLLLVAFLDARRLKALAAEVSEHLGQPVTAKRMQSGSISLRANGNWLCITPGNQDDISPANCAASLRWASRQ